MTRRKTEDASLDVKQKIAQALNAALETAMAAYAEGNEDRLVLPQSFRAALLTMSDACSSASTGFTNLVTALAVKAALEDNVDVRYHQVQIQDQTARPAGFSFRPVSENTVYPWLAQHGFEGAKSGWQTRVFERPKPYLLAYDENIQGIKDAFLACYDEIETRRADAATGLAFLVYRQILLRDKKSIRIAEPTTDDILTIVEWFRRHFFFAYRSKGASRLPVLALHAIYKVMIAEVERYAGMALKPLELHSAADAQTGAVGDIEVAAPDGRIFEAVEVKHDQTLTPKIVEDVKQKIMDKSVDRYYILTTHQDCEPHGDMRTELAAIQHRFGCQVIANGVLPSIKYYLRLLRRPAAVFPEYAALLRADKSIGHEHREAWNRLVTGA